MLGNIAIDLFYHLFILYISFIYFYHKIFM